MKWEVVFCDEFEGEFECLPEKVQDELLAQLLILEKFGPNLGRPCVDTLKSSSFSNMKELRFNAGNGVWRVAFCFDPKRQAIVLVAGDKSAVNQRRFYKKLIRTADDRYMRHLKQAGGV